MKKKILIGLLVLIVCGCSGSKNKEPRTFEVTFKSKPKTIIVACEYIEDYRKYDQAAEVTFYDDNGNKVGWYCDVVGVRTLDGGETGQ